MKQSSDQPAAFSYNNPHGRRPLRDRGARDKSWRVENNAGQQRVSPAAYLALIKHRETVNCLRYKCLRRMGAHSDYEDYMQRALLKLLLMRDGEGLPSMTMNGFLNYVATMAKRLLISDLRRDRRRFNQKVISCDPSVIDRVGCDDSPLPSDAEDAQRTSPPPVELLKKTSPVTQSARTLRKLILDERMPIEVLGRGGQKQISRTMGISQSSASRAQNLLKEQMRDYLSID